MKFDFIRDVGLFNWVVRTVVRQFNKRILRRAHFMRLPTGDQFRIPRVSQFGSEAYVTNADVDWGAEALLYKMLEGRGCFLDIGANIGYYSIYMRQKATRVFAFEPDPRMLQGLEYNIRDHPSVELVVAAVGETDGTASFTLAEHGELSHFSCDGDGEQIVVQMVSVDSFVSERALAVEAIKTDVEGFDIAVLKGASNTLRAQRPIVLTEAEPTQELLHFADEIDYAVFCFVRDKTTRVKSFVEFKFVSGDQATKMLFLLANEAVDRLISLAES